MNFIRKTVLTSFFGRYLVLVINFISTIILARILTPADIGIFSVAAVLVALAHVLRDFGVGQYIIQEKDLTKDRIRTAFTVTLFFAWSIAALLYLVSGVIGDFYKEPGIAEVLEVLSLNFVFIPFGSITKSYLTREMNFGAILKIDVSSSFVQAVVGVSAALLGEGYMSLAWSSLAGILWVVFFSQFYRPKELLLLPGIKDLKRVLSFGSMAGATGVLRTLGSGSPELILGRVLDMSAVGLFSRGQSTIGLFHKLVMSGLQPVIMPYFAKEHRQGENLKSTYLYVIACVTVVAWPFFVFTALMAFPMVALLYGDQWYGSVPVIQALCIYASVQILTAITDQVFTAIGQVKRALRLQLILQPLLIIVVLFSAQFGIVVVAQCMVIVPIVRLLLIQKDLAKYLNIKFKDYYSFAVKGIVVTGACAVVPVLISTMDMSPAFGVIIGLCLSAVVWVAAIIIIKHPIEKEVYSVFEKIRSRVFNKC